MLVPGDNDGTRDQFGVGDMWVVRRRSGEIDDGIGSNRARIGQFVNGQRVDGKPSWSGTPATSSTPKAPTRTTPSDLS